MKENVLERLHTENETLTAAGRRTPPEPRAEVTIWEA